MIWFGLNAGHNDEAFSKQFGLVKITNSWGQLLVSLGRPLKGYFVCLEKYVKFSKTGSRTKDL